jgi:hypothetical protein
MAATVFCGSPESPPQQPFLDRRLGKKDERPVFEDEKSGKPGGSSAVSFL